MAFIHIWLALASALATAVYYVYVSRTMKQARGLSSGFVLAISHMVGAVVLLPLWALYSAPVADTAPLITPLLLAAGLLVLSRELYFYAYARTDVANITVFSALTPIYAIGTGYFLLGETSTPLALTGMLLICASIYGLFVKKPAGMPLPAAILLPFRHIIVSLPVFCAFLSTIPTAFAAAFQRQLLHTLDPVGFSFFLLTLIGLTAFIISLALLKPSGLRAQFSLLPRHFLLISAIMLPLMHVLFSFVMQHQQTAVSLVLQRTSIAFQIALAYAFLKERRELRKRILATLGIMAGFVLIMVKYEVSVPLFITSDNDPAIQGVINRLAAPLKTEAAHPPTCAVVGNSGNLHDSDYGALIDTHDYIFRMNYAPTQGYEKDVGTRTTHHVMHSNQPHAEDYGPNVVTILIIDDFNANGAQYRKNVGLYLKYLAGEISADKLPWNTLSFDNDFPDNLFALTGGVHILHPAFVEYINTRWFTPEHQGNLDYPSTGFKTIVLAMRLCDHVDVFGFGANRKNGTWDHYFDEGEPLTGFPALHRADYQEQVLDAMERQGLIKIYRGKR